MKCILGLVALLSLPIAAYASTVYDVDLTTADYSAVGTITTDGNLGTLSTSDILAYDFTVSDAANTETFNATSVDATDGVTGSDLTATSTGLFYNFSDSGDSFSFLGFAGGSGPAFDGVCFGDAGGCFVSNTFSGVSVVVDDTLFQEPALTGNQQIATVASAVPEPTSLLLVGSGALGLLAIVRRRFGAGVRSC